LNGRLDPRPHAGPHALLRRATAAGPPHRPAVLADLLQIVVVLAVLQVVELLFGALRPIGQDRLVRVKSALAEVLRFDVADVQKPVAADAEIDERRLDARLQVDDLALINVADVVVLAAPLDV
jgi:hypothetical protein